MKTETLKFVRACAFGSAVCVAVALAIMPGAWWFGLLSGLAGGYLAGYHSYELEETWKTITGSGWFIWTFKTKHPYIYPPFVVDLLLIYPVVDCLRSRPYATFTSTEWAICLLLFIMMFVLLYFLYGLLALAGARARQDRRGWYYYEWEQTEYLGSFLEVLDGLVYIIVTPFCFLWSGLCFVCKFVCVLPEIYTEALRDKRELATSGKRTCQNAISSLRTAVADKKIMSGLGGATGGLVTLLIFGTFIGTLSLLQAAASILMGAFIGCAIGLLIVDLQKE